MRKSFLLLCACFFSAIALTQVNITMQIPPGGMVQKEQLWNLVVTSTEDAMASVQVKMNLQDAESGQTLMSARSGNLFLKKGARVITVRDLNPVLYHYEEQAFDNSFLPSGNYTVCYQVVRISVKGDELLADECSNLKVDPLSPPLLNTPSDNSTVETSHPQFTWIPPVSMNRGKDLTYDLYVTEVFPGQTPLEAIQTNTAVYQATRVNRSFENYSASHKGLDTGKIYAWQVIARRRDHVEGRTDVWTFRLRSDNTAVKPAGENFLLMQNDVQGLYQLDDRKLRIRFYSESGSYQSLIRILDSGGKPVQEKKVDMTSGSNNITITLKRDVDAAQVYTAVLTDRNQKQHFLRFQIK